MKSINKIVCTVLLMICGVEMLAVSGHAKKIASTKQRQTLLMRLSNIYNSLFRIKSHPVHATLRAQTMRLQQDFRKKDRKHALTVRDVQNLHAKANVIQCKINCASKHNIR